MKSTFLKIAVIVLLETVFIYFAGCEEGESAETFPMVSENLEYGSNEAETEIIVVSTRSPIPKFNINTPEVLQSGAGKNTRNFFSMQERIAPSALSPWWLSSETSGDAFLGALDL